MKKITEADKNIEIKNCPVEIANDIWNAAIEAAAIHIEEKFDFLGEELLAAQSIRSLKK